VAESSGPQTLIFYFRPSDAQCPAYRQEDLALDQFQGFPAECARQADPDTGRVCADGTWSAYGENCRFDYSNAWLYLTAEGCQATVDSVATLVSVRYFEQPLNCACEFDEDCSVGSCQLDASIDAPWCSGPDRFCAGLCSPLETSCEGEGEVCGVSVNGEECASIVTCVDGVSVCPIPQDCGT
jgi:hypothetical protein